MKVTKIFMMAALALIFAACSNNDDNDFAQQPAEQPANGEITITATLDANDGASTRALQDPDGENKIASTWETTDQFAILYNNGTEDTKSIATVDKIDGTTVTITFTVSSSLANNTACTIVYPASAANAANTGADVAKALATQDGTIGNCPEVRVGTATIDKDNHSLSDVTKLTAQNAIFKFTLDGQRIDGSHPLVIKKGENDVVTTVTPASSTTSVYVAMPAAASSTYKFIVKTDDNKYIKSGTAAITAGKYYQTTLDLSTARYPLALSLSSATVDDLGSVIGADGNIYLNMTAATNASTTAVAKIVYVGSDNGEATPYNHGLALALSDASTGCKWSTSYGTVHTYKAESSTFTKESGLQYNDVTHNSEFYPAFKAAIANNGTAAPTGGCSSWFLASGYQWKQMIGATGLNNLGLTGNAYYWSSTERDADSAWIISTLDGDWGNWGSIAKDKDDVVSLSRVRACLAF